MAKSRSVVCSSCGKNTLPAQMCMYCGAQLIARATPSREEDHISFVKRARHAASRQSQLRMVQLVAVNRLRDGSLPGIKKLSVRQETATLLVLPSGEFQALPTGDHDVSELGVGGGLEASLLATNAAAKVFFCTVSKRPIVVDLVLPDGVSCGHEESVEASTSPDEEEEENVLAKIGERALKSLSLRTADNMFGGVTMQMILRCTEPSQLISMLAMAKFEDLIGRKDKEQRFFGDTQASNQGGVLNAMKYPGRLISHILAGGGTEPDSRRPLEFDLMFSDLYKAIRLELTSAIIESVRNEIVHRIYDEVEVRERVAGDIKRIMSTSMKMYGLEIERVSAFRFICPEFEDLLRQRGEDALDRERLQDDQDRLEIGQQRRKMAADDAVDVSNVKAETAKSFRSDKEGVLRHAIDERRATREAAGKLLAESQQRKMDRHAALRDHSRSQEAADEELAISLRRKKLQMLLDLQNDMQDRESRRRITERSAEVDNRLRLVDAYGKLPEDMSADSILAATLVENPELASAFGGLAAAKGQTELLERERQFQDRLSQVYKEQSQPYQQVWEEVASFPQMV